MRSRMVPIILWLLMVCAIGLPFTASASPGSSISLSPVSLAGLPPSVNPQGPSNAPPSTVHSPGMLPSPTPESHPIPAVLTPASDLHPNSSIGPAAPPLESNQNRSPFLPFLPIDSAKAPTQVSGHRAFHRPGKAPSPNTQSPYPAQYPEAAASSSLHNNASSGMAPTSHNPAIHTAHTPSSSFGGESGNNSAPPPSLLTTKEMRRTPPPLSIAPLPALSYPPSFSPSVSPSSSPADSPRSHNAFPVSSSRSPSSTPIAPFRPQLVFPPPPPNADCSASVCAEPYATSPGLKCACVLPMQVQLRLGVDLYTFFPLVSELSTEIAVGIFMQQSQVRIMGANADPQEPGKTIVIINLVPLGNRFDNTTSFLAFERFWHKKVPIKSSYFGGYDVLYVQYPDLPPSPPMQASGAAGDGGDPSSDFGMITKPLGVDVRKKQMKKRIGGEAIVIICLSAAVGLAIFGAVAGFLVARNRKLAAQSNASQLSAHPFLAKFSGTPGSAIGNGLSSASLSFGSSIATYTGSAKTFSTLDIHRATNKFDNGRILGEGGFGRVYSGLLEDGTAVAVKLLKRDDHQSGREFMAEIEMLNRLHHRNLVKLIGMCTEEGSRCLVYELIPNGSVDSHLHGIHKEVSPLDWDARIKIALGSARGLAYLHEDSNPRVIHRDFKSSNILLEEDFTPKVSDFGLARAALEEESRHISTRVMGTFGYVAPEYAMTGHLLVKSDVYSYGVVLLELLTGRKPVDMSQPPGEENLVTWARPLLTSREGLEEIIDPSLRSDVSYDNVAKVAAIASMCVQPEVSHRPFMGEVVQALKLVCNECDEAKEVVSTSPSHNSDAGGNSSEGSSINTYRNVSFKGEYDSEPDIERGLPLSELYRSSGKYMGLVSGSCRRQSISGPLMTGNGRSRWHKLRRPRRGSVSEHGIMLRLWPGSH